MFASKSHVLLAVLLGLIVGRLLPSEMPCSEKAPVEPKMWAEGLGRVQEEPVSIRAAHVEKLMANVEEEYRTMCRGILEGQPVSFAQGWQDWMIYHNYFRDREWGDGFYLDIGSNDATFISNTLFFDKCLGWRGICAEPQERYHAKIREKRGCQLVPTCVLGHDATVRTSKTGVDFAVEETEDSTVGGMQCVGIQTLKSKYSFDKIDLVSVDIEGAEPHVLKCWPFEAVETSVFLVETNKHDLHMVDLFFHRKGYFTADSFTNVVDDGNTHFIDNLYVKNTKPFMHPPTNFECNPEMKSYMGNWCNPFAMEHPDRNWFGSCERVH